eukprot:Phypoly_transcript_03956.p1 GENE.Phypoly_transcript_03956~~Phypoly_transcript_03956.p1  ORF type:complete len:659 (+),score=143.62 Phypoly_transcript_03956:176-2152(+)
MEQNTHYLELCTHIANLEFQLKSCENSLKQEEYDTTREKVEKHFEECIQELESRRDHLVHRIDEIREYQRKSITETQKNLKESIQECKESMKVATRFYQKQKSTAELILQEVTGMNPLLDLECLKINLQVHLPSDLLSSIKSHGSVSGKRPELEPPTSVFGPSLASSGSIFAFRSAFESAFGSAVESTFGSALGSAFKSTSGSPPTKNSQAVFILSPRHATPFCFAPLSGSTQTPSFENDSTRAATPFWDSASTPSPSSFSTPFGESTFAFGSLQTSPSATDPVSQFGTPRPLSKDSRPIPTNTTPFCDSNPASTPFSQENSTPVPVLEKRVPSLPPTQSGPSLDIPIYRRTLSTPSISTPALHLSTPRAPASAPSTPAIHRATSRALPAQENYTARTPFCPPPQDLTPHIPTPRAALTSAQPTPFCTPSKDLSTSHTLSTPRPTLNSHAQLTPFCVAAAFTPISPPEDVSASRAPTPFCTPTPTFPTFSQEVAIPHAQPSPHASLTSHAQATPHASLVSHPPSPHASLTSHAQGTPHASLTSNAQPTPFCSLVQDDYRAPPALDVSSIEVDFTLSPFHSPTLTADKSNTQGPFGSPTPTFSPTPFGSVPTPAGYTKKGQAFGSFFDTDTTLPPAFTHAFGSFALDPYMNGHELSPFM